MHYLNFFLKTFVINEMYKTKIILLKVITLVYIEKRMENKNHGWLNGQSESKS